MSKFEGSDFDNVSQSINANKIKAAYNAWKSKWNEGKKWGIVGGTADDPKPKTVLEQVLEHGDATYARDQARSIEGLGDLITSIEEILDGDVIETAHVEALDTAIDGMLSILRNKKWNPRNIPFYTIVEFAETDDPKKPKVEKKTVYGHYRTEAYNKYVEWAMENKENFKGKPPAPTDSSWYNAKQGKAEPPMWQAITGEGDTESGKGGILAIANDAKDEVDKITIGDDTQIAVYNISTGPAQLAQIKSVQEKVIEVLQNPNIYPAGKSRAPVKDRLNAAFSEESYAIRNKEEAALLSFAKGFNRIANIEEIKSVKLRFPTSNKSLNAVIRNVLKNLGEDIKQYQTPKAKDGTASAGLTLKAEPKSWSDILKVDEEKSMIAAANRFINRIKFDNSETKRFYQQTDKDYQRKSRGRFTYEGDSSFAGSVRNFYEQNKRKITMADLQRIKSETDANMARGNQNRYGTVAPDAGRFLTRG